MRVVSLAPAATEILFALGLGHRVAAVTDHCDYPPEAANKERVGPFARPDTEMITALRPDLVVTGGKMHTGTEATLAAAGITIYRFFPGSVAELLTAMEELGELCAAGETGRSIIGGLRRRVGEIEERAAARQKTAVLFLMGEPPLTTPGPASCQYDALRLAGAGPVPFPESDAFVRLTWERLEDCDPAVILACGRVPGQPAGRKCPGCGSARPPCRREVEELYADQRLAGLQAVRRRRIHPVPCSFLCRPGPRMVDGMAEIAKLLESWDA